MRTCSGRMGPPSSPFGNQMLENLNLKRKLSTEEFNRVLPGLQRRMYDLEKACWDNKVMRKILFKFHLNKFFKIEAKEFGLFVFIRRHIKKIIKMKKITKKNIFSENLHAL